MTSVLLWAYAAISCVSAVIFHKSQELTLIALLICTALYTLMYSKLAFFRWLPRR